MGLRTEKEERSTGAASDVRRGDGGRGVAVSSCSDIEKRAGEPGERGVELRSCSSMRTEWRLLQWREGWEQGYKKKKKKRKKKK